MWHCEIRLRQTPRVQHMGQQICTWCSVRALTSCGAIDPVAVSDFRTLHIPCSNVSWFPYSQQDDKWSVLDGANNESHSTSWGPSVQMFSPDQIPIKRTLAQSFGVFNR